MFGTVGHLRFPPENLDRLRAEMDDPAYKNVDGYQSSQLLVDEKGSELVRFAYSTDGTARRGPVTLRGRDLERFRAALADHPAIRGALGMTA